MAGCNRFLWGYGVPAHAFFAATRIVEHAGCDHRYAFSIVMVRIDVKRPDESRYSKPVCAPRMRAPLVERRLGPELLVRHP